MDEQYRQLLIKYMIIVIGEEGVDFINAAEFHVSLTADELLLLQQAAKEAKEAL